MTWKVLNDLTISDGRYDICTCFKDNRKYFVLWDKKAPGGSQRIDEFGTSGAAQLKVEALKDERARKRYWTKPIY